LRLITLYIDGYIDEGKAALQQLGFQLELLDIASADTQQCHQAFAAAEIICIAGGNTFYLLQQLNLPIPSYARVTNLSNGKTVVVRVNDRGPFHANRVMDLSYAAAQQLGFVRAGTAQVRVEQIVPGERIQPAGTGGNIYVEGSAYSICNCRNCCMYLG